MTPHNQPPRIDLFGPHSVENLEVTFCPRIHKPVSRHISLSYLYEYFTKNYLKKRTERLREIVLYISRLEKLYPLQKISNLVMTVSQAIALAKLEAFAYNQPECDSMKEANKWLTFLKELPQDMILSQAINRLKVEKDNIKQSYPTFISAALIPIDQKKQQGNVTSHTGLISGDIDNIPTELFEAVFEAICNHPSIILAYRSASGTGIGCIVYIPNTTVETHRPAFDLFAVELRQQLEKSGGADLIDLACSDINRHRFIPYEKEYLYFNRNPVPLLLDLEYIKEWKERIRKRKEEQQRRKLTTDKGYVEAVLEDIFEFFETYGGNFGEDYSMWRNLGFALMEELQDEDLARQYFLRFSAQALAEIPGKRRLREGQANSNFSRIASSWATVQTNNPVTLGSIIYYAKQQGYSMPSHLVARYLDRKKCDKK